MELFKALSESTTSIQRTVDEYRQVANIISSEITDIKKYQNNHLKTFLLNSNESLEDENFDEEDDDDEEGF